MAPDFLTLPDRKLAYQLLRGRPHWPGIMFLGGYASDMTGTKAGFLAAECAQADCSYLRFDYRGHGRSSNSFKDGTIGDWFDDACVVFDRLTEGPQILIGSSMGGWLALMLARARPERVKALIGVAAAPDFTEDLLWQNLSLQQKARLEQDGEINDGGLAVTLRLIQEARRHLILRRPIHLSCPAHFLQGMQDDEVPWHHAIRIAEAIAHKNVRVTLIKDGDHRLSRAEDLALLWHVAKSNLL